MMNLWIICLSCSIQMLPRRQLLTTGRLRCRLLLACSLVAYSCFSLAQSWQISGADDELEQNLQTHLAVIEVSTDNYKTRKKLDRAAREASEALGYYRAQFSWQLGGEHPVLEVTPGPRVTLDKAVLNVNGDPPSTDFTPHDQPCTAGKGIDHRCYEKLKRQWLDQIQDMGYLDAGYVKHQLQIDPEKLKAWPVLSVETGERYTLQNLVFIGSQLDSGLLKRLAPLKTGDPIESYKLLQLRQNLENSRYFSSIALKVNKTGPDTADLEINLEDTASHRINLGVGYGTDTDVRGSIRMETPALNSAGHRLVNELKLSGIRQELSSNYRIPLNPPLEKFLEFNAALEREKLDDTETSLARFGAYLTDQWAHNWQARYGTSLYYEEQTIGHQPKDSSWYLLPGIDLSRLVLERTLDPSSGSSMVLSAAGSSDELGADTKFLRLRAGYKRLQPLWGSHRLLARVEAGVIVTDAIHQVPLTQRFFTGGDQTVRGYSYNSLGPRNAEGDVEGGKYLNVASLEYSFAIRPSWRLALFFDAGRAYNHNNEDWNKGAGIGVRWISPIGQVKVDIATPVYNNEESGIQLHISMGSIL